MRDETRERPVLPVNLLLEKRSCLVVGGGAVAARKVGHLLDACAEVTVVSPRIGPVIEALVRARRIRHVDREFTDSDVNGCRLVFAATDDQDVNRRVLECCRREGILCGAADANWPDGDFVTPAITRQDGVIVTVSTGGRSCRLARVIKDRLAALVAGIVSEEKSESGGSL